MIFQNSKKKQNVEIIQRKKHLLSNFPTGSRYAEAYRTLRTNLHFAAMEKQLSSVVVTSSVPSEGKTNTAINLGFTMAQAGRRTLLLDGDLRKPVLSKIFDQKRRFGLADLISDTLGRDVVKGSITQYSIGDMFMLMKFQKKTGTFKVSSTDQEVTFYIIGGKVNDILWNNCPKDRKLTAQMVHQGKITKENARISLAHQEKTGQRLGDIFYSMGFLSRQELEKELDMNALEALRVVSLMTEGKFVFTPLKEREVRASVLPRVNIEELYGDFYSQGENLIYINKGIDEAIKITDQENLFILPAGRVPPNPAELIESDRAEFLMEILKERFDFIVVDTSPVMPTSDALLMAPRTDGVLLVVLSGETNKKIVKEVVDRFRAANLSLLGVVLNRVDMANDRYYSYYDSGY